jgi:HAD superfamily hydrolase (TIGR01509 family)
MAIRGAIFDMDGTLVDSKLDFDAMRREMGLAGTLPLLEAIAQANADDAERCWAVLHEHESRGAERATLFPGVRQFLDALAERGLRRAVFTRNSRLSTTATLDRLRLAFDPVVCREDGPAKPHPAAIWKICETWGLRPSECIMIGDYRFDIEAGRRAGAHTVLFSGSGQASGLEENEAADHHLPAFTDTAAFWAWIAQIDLGATGGSC